LAGVMVVLAFGLIEFLLRRPVGISWEVKFIDLKSKTPAELVSFAEENGVENASTMPKQELLFAILKQLRAPNQVAADPSAAVAADPSAAVAADPSAALVWLVALALTAGWLYVLGAGASKLVLWLFF
jgi:Rho termination factor-like protein